MTRHINTPTGRNVDRSRRFPSITSLLLRTAVAVLLALPGTPAHADLQTCGDPFVNGDVGPWDYTNAEDRSNPNRILIVERHHFNNDVESVGNADYALDNLDYTLRAVPNHHRALNAIARYQVEKKGGIPPTWRSAECWFERAQTFRPEDGTVWLIYGNMKVRQNDTAAALEAYETAHRLMPKNIEVDYNLGLLYFRLGEYDKALNHAKTAYAGNYPLQGLRRKLADKGYRID